MSVYSFENKKSVPVRVLSFHFAVGKMKTAILMNYFRLSKPRENFEKYLPATLFKVFLI